MNERLHTARLVAALGAPAALVAAGMFLWHNVEITFLLYTGGGCLLAPRIVLGRAGRRAAWPFLPPPGRRRAAARRALYLWLLFGPALFVPYALVRPHLGDPRAYLAALESYGFQRERLPLYTVLFLALVPWCEERWWRGEALPLAIRRFGPRAGLAVASLAFASYHVAVLAPLVPPSSLAVRMVFITAGGVVWGLAAMRDRSWAGCWASHLLGADLVIVLIFALFAA